MTWRSTALASAYFLLFACRASDGNDPVKTLTGCLARPDQLSTICHFAWKAAPQVMSPLNQDDAEFIGTLSGFWWDFSLDATLLEAASSNLLQSETGDVVVFTALFKERRAADNAAVHLSQLHANKVTHASGQYGRLVMVMGRRGGVSEDCFANVKAIVHENYSKVFAYTPVGAPTPNTPLQPTGSAGG